jgi:hypothetical protein
MTACPFRILYPEDSEGRPHARLAEQAPIAFALPDPRPNPPLQLTPLRVERDRSDFTRQNQVQCNSDLSGRRS